MGGVRYAEARQRQSGDHKQAAGHSNPLAPNPPALKYLALKYLHRRPYYAGIHSNRTSYCARFGSLASHS